MNESEGTTLDGASQLQQRLPTRVLEIPPDLEANRIFLRDTLPEETGQFLCLSYTWGPVDGFQSHYSKLGRIASSDGIILDQLPETIQDAIKVTRDLNVRYLWVDGLCIRQDDPSDKLRELPCMHSYYRNASLVIHCSGTKSITDHFLRHAELKLPKRDEGSETPDGLASAEQERTTSEKNTSENTSKDVNEQMSPRTVRRSILHPF